MSKLAYFNIHECVEDIVIHRDLRISRDVNMKTFTYVYVEYFPPTLPSCYPKSVFHK